MMTGFLSVLFGNVNASSHVVRNVLDELWRLNKTSTDVKVGRARASRRGSALEGCGHVITRHLRLFKHVIEA